MSERDGYEHGVPSLDRRRPPRPRAGGRLLHRAVRLGGGARGEYIRLPPPRPRRRRHRRRRGRPPGARTCWVDERRRGRRAREGRRRQRPDRALRRPRRRPHRRARRPRRRRLHRRRAGRATGAPRCVNEPGAWAMSALIDARPRGREGLLRRRLRLGDRHVRRRRPRGHPVAPARLRGRRAGAAGARRRRRRRRSPATTPPLGASTSGSTTSTPPPRARPSSAAPCSTGPVDMPIGRRAVLADPQGATFSVSRVVPA